MFTVESLNTKTCCWFLPWNHPKPGFLTGAMSGSRIHTMLSPLTFEVWSFQQVAVANSRNRNSKMGCPGNQVEHGPKSAVCPSCSILSHSQVTSGDVVFAAKGSHTGRFLPIRPTSETLNMHHPTPKKRSRASPPGFFNPGRSEVGEVVPCLFLFAETLGHQAAGGPREAKLF